MTSEGTGSNAVLSFAPKASVETQYQSAMDGVVVVDRSHLSRVEATGADCEGFLHNMLSADIKALGSSTGTRATFLTVKGKLVSDLTVFREAGRFLLEMETTRVEPLVAALSRYIISEDVTLRSLVEDEAAFSLEGREASAHLSRLTGVSGNDLDELGHLCTRLVDGARLTAHRHEPSPRFDVAASPGDARILLEKAIEAGAVVAGELVAEIRRIESGRPRFGIDMDDSHMPMEAGLGDAINFDKGCYIGQEYVVRLAHRGHLNRKLVGVIVQATDAPAKGTPVEVAGQPAGELTSAAYSPRRGAVVALGYLKREFFEPGTDISVGGHAGRVSPLPFV